ncbi:MAG: hypothetical protein A2114_01920 [Candidatus Vogelbacteria bacterium GWA1_51_14]|uniref:NTP pyrophosphohydrolase MazG-like domain-containing protein n=1 Tax=Candidatus Vogelbacteria bacterium GWA1_51_14 TaxID=1802435 RepID=A0A1G2QCC5_9BACT|nr:MAG: hypothetical protein A2114_01920 [Candidatus Vogelbacteria bacterium GWA1_51_14]
MEFKDYQRESRKVAKYVDAGKNFIYPTLGLTGEAGEVADVVKKIMRDDGMKVSPEKKEELKKELGDVLWYVAQVATEFDLDLEDVAQTNLAKLFSRLERGVLGGSGNDR